MHSTVEDTVLMGVLIAGAYLLPCMSLCRADEAKKADREKPVPWASAVWADAKLDANGNLLPLQSYGETVERSMKYLFDMEVAFAGSNRIKDESGKTRPPYLFYCSIKKGVLTADALNWPGHFAYYTQGFLNYYVFSGNGEALSRAEELAEWNMAHSTPVDWKYGGMIYSTVSNGKLGGYSDGDAIQLDKSAIMAGAYLRLYRVTGKEQYLKAAQQIATTLAKTQQPEGNWPFRVNPQTGEVREAYTSSAICAVELFEQLDAMNRNREFDQARTKTINWLLKGPTQDMVWKGFYEDVPNSPDNRTNWDCVDTARWLIRYRDENKEYLPLALKLHDWIKNTFVDENTRFAPAHSVREQLVCNIGMIMHSLHWAVLLSELYEVTGDEKYRRDAANIASSFTYHLQANNRLHLGPDWPEETGCGHVPVNNVISIWYLMDVFGCIPEIAPKNHLLRYSAEIQAISYKPDVIAYTTAGPSRDVLKLAGEPEEVTVDGQALPAGDGVVKGWHFDEETGILRLAHDGRQVVVQGP